MRVHQTRGKKSYTRSTFSVLRCTPYIHLRHSSAPSSIDVSGLVAHVDLFAVHPPESMLRAYTGEDLPPSSAGPSSNTPSSHRTIQSGERSSSHHDQSRDEDTIVIDEDAILTSAVFGSSFVHAVQVLDLSGENVILFVFAVSLGYTIFL
jgi:hypothetical protein